MKFLLIAITLLVCSIEANSQIITVKSSASIDVEVKETRITVTQNFHSGTNPRRGHSNGNNEIVIDKPELINQLKEHNIKTTEIVQTIDTTFRNEKKFLIIKTTNQFDIINITKSQIEVIEKLKRQRNNIKISNVKVKVDRDAEHVNILNQMALDQSKKQANRIAKTLNKKVKEIVEIEVLTEHPAETSVKLWELQERFTYELKVKLNVSYNTENL